MKRFILPLLFGILFCLTNAVAQTPARLTMPLRAVTLYPSSAELHHRGEMTLPAGAAVVRLAGLSPYLVGASVQAEVSGAELESVEIKVDAAALNSPLADSLRLAQQAVRQLLNEQTANAAEKAFLDENKRVSPAGPTAAGGWLAEVQRGAAYYRSRLAALAQREVEIAELLPLQKRRADELGQRVGLPSSYNARRLVILQLNLPRPATIHVDVSYQLGANSVETGWMAEYDLRVEEDKPAQLQVLSRIKISNHTGFAWTNVPVNLRTAEPAADVSRPSLDPWSVSFGRAGNEGEGRLDDFAVKGPGTAGTAGAANSEAPDLGARLRLPAPVTLANNAEHTFRLGEQTLPMRLEYLAVPKLEEEVMLVGKVADWNRVNFLAETAKVFFRGAYVGETTLDTRAYTDTLEVALGRDPQVQLTRTKREDFAGPASGDRERTRLLYELNVRNTHTYPVRLRLLDQVPISQEKEITVKVLEISGADLDAASGKLTWLFSLAPGATRKLPFSFQVDAPAKKPINLRRNRYIKSPKFR